MLVLGTQYSVLSVVHSHNRYRCYAQIPITKSNSTHGNVIIIPQKYALRKSTVYISIIVSVFCRTSSMQYRRQQVKHWFMLRILWAYSHCFCLTLMFHSKILSTTSQTAGAIERNWPHCATEISIIDMIVSEWKGFNVPSAQNRLYRDKVDASKTR